MLQAGLGVGLLLASRAGHVIAGLISGANPWGEGEREGAGAPGWTVPCWGATPDGAPMKSCAPAALAAQAGRKSAPALTSSRRRARLDGFNRLSRLVNEV